MRIADTIMSLILHSPATLMAQISVRAKELRLAQNLTQEALASRSGVSLGTLKKFERTGQVSLQSLLRLAIALGASEGFEQLFTAEAHAPISLDALLATPKKRKRGRVI
jgi:transcriptional regulator with XRE-family HTH domain